MRVIGTAGHVDHGKSTLVRALTGINPDRLKEEQEREMTIDLGFAWMTLPSGETVSIVDVPGHEDFIKNMLAGVGGIDAALFVVAADESVMPQTREHLAILDLLQVRSGVVALTKADLVADPEWLELVKLDVAGLLEGTALADAPIIPVSARTGLGLKELVAKLDRLLQTIPPRRDVGRARLPIDRAFTLPGFGTIVTGTLVDGRLRVGEEVEILPRKLKARIRGLQTHKTKLETAVPGSRVAINLVGVSVEELARGDIVAQPGWLLPTLLVDVRAEVLADPHGGPVGAPRPLIHNMEVIFFSGSAEIPARTRILGTQEIAPGRSGWAQLRLAHPTALVQGDRFILRQPSPGVTLGGGFVVDPQPRARHRRFSPDVLQHLETLAHGGSTDILLAAVRRAEPCPAGAAIQGSGLGETAGRQALAELLQRGQLLVLEGDTPAGEPLNSQALIVSAAGWATLLESLKSLLRDYHRQFPLRAGMPREEVKSRLRVQQSDSLRPRVFAALVERGQREGHVAASGTVVHLAEHRAAFSAEQQTQIDRLLATLADQPYTPPSVAEAETLVGTDVFNALMEQGTLTRVSSDVFFLTSTYQQMVDRIVAHLRGHGKITVAEVRDMFNASRKYALALMEHLDERRVTRRVGDERVLR